MGVPTLGCDCAVCHSSDPRDRRTRPSIMLEYEGKVVLIDTTPDFYAQAVRENITRVDAVLYTHTHADHMDAALINRLKKPGTVVMGPPAVTDTLNGAVGETGEFDPLHAHDERAADLKPADEIEHRPALGDRVPGFLR